MIKQFLKIEKILISFLKKIQSLLDKLSSKPKIGGMQISNAGIQYVIFEKGKPKSFSLKFSPGVILDGKVKNKDQFLEIVKQLHSLVSPEKPNISIQTVVSLPAGMIYTQSFTVPNIDEEKLFESATLNLQMISPLPPNVAYMSWQIILEDLEHYELLGAFAEKSAVDDIQQLLITGGFTPVVSEFPSLSLSHLLEEVSNLKDKIILVFMLSGDGINLFLIRHGTLHFDYFRSWQSIQGDENQISQELFEKVSLEEAQKVINFTMSRFKEGVSQIFMIAPGYEEEIKSIFSKQFSINTNPLIFNELISPSWYVPCGAALRGSKNISNDKFINLNSETSSDVFYEEHVLGFLQLWRNAFVIVLGFFVIVFGVSTYFLAKQLKTLKERLVVSKMQVNKSEFEDFSKKAQKFNSLVSAISSEPRALGFWYDFLDYFSIIAEKEDIKILSIETPSPDAPVSITAEAPSTAAAVDFKTALTKDERFLNVELPLLSIVEQGDNTIKFSMSFRIKRI